MNSFLKIKEEDASMPMSVTIDSDLQGIVLLTRLCQLATELDMGDGYDISDIYNQLFAQIEQFGTMIELDEDQ